MTTGPGIIEAPPPPARKGPIERLLSPIADIHPGEASSVLLMTLTMFLVFAGYYLLKTAREGLILSEGGAEVKTYASAGQALLLLVLVPAYGALASRFNRAQLVQWVTLFFAANLAVFMVALEAGMRIGVVYFLWFGIFNVMVIAQFWGFAADLYTQEQGKRLFPLVGVGGSLGAWLGSLRAGRLVENFGTTRLLIGGAAALVVCAILARIVDRKTVRAAHPGEPKAAARADEKIAPGPTGFRLLLTDRYLTLIAALVLVMNVVNTSGEYLFGKYVVNAAIATYGAGADAEAARAQFISATYSSYFSSINLIGLLLQLFVVSRVFKLVGVGRALFIHPIISFFSYLIMLRAPSLGTIRTLKIADNAVSYSLGSTTMQALWLPTSRETKYKAKQAVDAFCVRAGDVLQAAIVYSGELAAVSISGFAALNVVFAAGWLAIAAGLRRRLHDRAQETGTAEL